MDKKQNENLENSLKIIARTSVIVFIGIFISKILGYAYRMIMARYFGPEVYGLFSEATMVSGFFIAIAALGLGDGLLRFISYYRGNNESEKIKYVFKFSLIVLVIAGILAGLLLFVLSDFIATSSYLLHDPSLIIYLKIFSFAIPITILGSAFLVALRAHEEIGWYSFIFNIAQNVVKVGLLVLFVIIGIGPLSIPISYVLGMLAMLIIAYAICKYKISHIFNLNNLPSHEKKVVRRELMNYSIPIFLLSAVSIILYWVDTFSIGHYKTAVEVGFYNAVFPIAALLSIAPELFMQIFFPMITREYARKNIKLIEQLGKQVAKWILLVNIPVFAILFAFPGAAINIFFGSQYLVAETALRILAINMLIASVLIVPNQFISMIGKSKLILFNIITTSVLNLILNSIFVPMPRIGFLENSNGINGAALATLISVVVLNLMFIIEAYYYLKIIPLRRKMISIFLIAAVPTAALFYLRTIISSNSAATLAVLGIGFILTYILLILIFKLLDENDWEIIKMLSKRIRRLFSKKN